MILFFTAIDFTCTKRQDQCLELQLQYSKATNLQQSEVCTWIDLSRPFNIYGWKPPSCKSNTSIMRKFVIISWKTHPLSQYAITEIIDSTLHNPLCKDGRDVDGYQTKPYKNGHLTFKCLDIG